MTSSSPTPAPTAFTCQFIDPDREDKVINMEVDRSVDDLRRAIAEATGIEHNRLTLRATASGKYLKPSWILNGYTMKSIPDVTVLVNPPPVSKVYRIRLETTTDERFSFLLQLEIPQSDDVPMELKWAMDERYMADNNSYAALNDSNAYPTNFGVNSSDRHYTLNFSCDFDGQSNDLSFVYFPHTGTWIPRSVGINEEEKYVFSFKVAEVAAATPNNCIHGVYHQATLMVE